MLEPYEWKRSRTVLRRESGSNPADLVDFYKDFVSEIFSYPTTYIVDGEGNIIGAPIVGNVKKQIDTVNDRLALSTASDE